MLSVVDAALNKVASLKFLNVGRSSFEHRFFVASLLRMTGGRIGQCLRRERRERLWGRFMDNVLAGAGKAMGFINDVFGGVEVRETGLWG